ncbi:RNA polymerase sigma factor [Fibrella aquatica]|jgi:RNA polymerase sigma factor (sigma-70 family)|uniref:RNA polymerase sigma factor n=1 Tax=Fibrella aquatica TaxID=3242487 RepID=UPI0035225A92
MTQVYADEAIIEAYLKSGEEHLFTEIYNRYHQKVYQSCLHLLHNPEEAQDQTQEIFCKVYTRLSTFRAEARFSTWLFVLTRYHCLSVLDTLKKRTFVSLDSLGDTPFGSVQIEEPTLDERWFQAERTLNQLSVQDQQLLRRRYLANKDVNTLADEARVSVSAMKMRLKRARDQARAFQQKQA